MLHTPARAPEANAYCERLVGTIRRECLDFMIPLGEKHLRRILAEWVNPTYLTVLALAYFRSGQPEKAVVTQRQALNRPNSLLGIARMRQRNYTSMREHSLLRTIEKLGIRLARHLYYSSGSV